MTYHILCQIFYETSNTTVSFVESILVNLLKKLVSILLLALLLCNVLASTFIFLVNEWQESHKVKETSFVEVKDEQLIFKMQLSLPYQSEWKNELIDGNTAVFEGEFYQSYEQVYRADTLYTYYRRINISRDNIMALMNEAHENLNIFSNNHQTTGQKALEFSKHLTKDYVEFRTKTMIWYKVENLPIKNFAYTKTPASPSLSVNAPPPIYSLLKLG
ncbi:hypothetical protein [Emticicia oligotrophica]|nr:hypothetical protein [Emticicia oligotrophica]